MNRNYGGRTKRVRGLVSTPAHPKVSLSRPTATGGDWGLHIRLFLRRNNPDVVEKSVATTGWQCGQQAKNSAQPFYSQARKMPFVLN